MGREGTRGSSSRKKSPKRGGLEAAETNSNEETNSSTNEEPKEEDPAPRHPLARVAEGMNRKSLLTGMYGSRGERVRHVVAMGAVSMPEDALEIMEGFESKDSTANEPKNTKKRKHALPELDSVVRPSLDRSLEKIVVTDVFHKSYANSVDPTQPPSLRTVAANRFVDLLTPAVAATGVPDAERIRGGGGEEAPGATNPQPVQAPAPAPPADPPAGNSMQSVAPQQAQPPAPVAAPQAAAAQAAAAATAATPQPQPAAAPAPAPSSVATPTTTTSATVPSAAVTSAPTPAPAPAAAMTTPAKAPSSTTTAPSSATKPAEAAKDKLIPLAKKPDPHWVQHIPSANDENLTDPQAKTAKPGWYQPDVISNLERTLLPEWFDSSASHRNPETYLKARETMVHISQQLGNRFVTSTLARRSLPGDVGSLHRLHNFLTCYLWMNEEGRNDSAPTAASLQQPPQLVNQAWTEKRRGYLLEAVVEVSNKKQKTEEGDAMEVDEENNDDGAFVAIDWDTVAQKVGATAGECEREFLAMPMDDASVATTTERPLTPDTMASGGPPKTRSVKDEMAQEEFVRSLVEETSPNVIRAVTKAALTATNQNLLSAQRAARLGLVAGQAAQAAQAHEETVSRLLSEVIDQRMQKLECRMALMDDLEGLLEAERVALELERRDLYTTRCRDWFGSN